MGSGVGSGMIGFGGTLPGSVTTSDENSVNSASAAGAAFGTQQNPGQIVNWFTGKDPTAHNEAIYAWQREAASAQQAREWEKQMADTQMQRKVADYQKAGFSPLAALEGTGGNYTPQASAASSSAAARGSNNTGQVLAGIISALVFAATRSASAANAAQASQSLEATRQANRIALEAIKSRAAMDRALVGSVTKDARHKVLHYVEKFNG